jgi:predicted DNA-binding WGR domain protein
MTTELPSSVCLASDDPSTNRRRLYRLTWQQTLWGEGALVRWWGRRGSEGRSQVRYYPDPEGAQVAFQRIVRLRLLHGYRRLA